MKISDEEINAAAEFIWDSPPTPVGANIIRKALEAAYTVRKARKAAKRAKAKPSILDEDQQEALGNAAGEPSLPVDSRPALCRFRLQDEGKAYPRSSCLACGASVATGLGKKCGRSVPEPAKPEWNGKFEVGKAYRTRDGRIAEIIKRTEDSTFPINGIIEGAYMIARLSWREDGRYSCDFPVHPCDLIGPWED